MRNQFSSKLWTMALPPSTPNNNYTAILVKSRALLNWSLHFYTFKIFGRSVCTWDLSSLQIRWRPRGSVRWCAFASSCCHVESKILSFRVWQIVGCHGTDRTQMSNLSEYSDGGRIQACLSWIEQTRCEWIIWPNLFGSSVSQLGRIALVHWQHSWLPWLPLVQLCHCNYQKLAEKWFGQALHHPGSAVGHPCSAGGVRLQSVLCLVWCAHRVLVHHKIAARRRLGPVVEKSGTSGIVPLSRKGQRGLPRHHLPGNTNRHQRRIHQGETHLCHGVFELWRPEVQQIPRHWCFRGRRVHDWNSRWCAPLLLALHAPWASGFLILLGRFHVEGHF